MSVVISVGVEPSTNSYKSIVPSCVECCLVFFFQPTLLVLVISELAPTIIPSFVMAFLQHDLEGIGSPYRIALLQAVSLLSYQAGLHFFRELLLFGLLWVVQGVVNVVVFFFV